MSELVRNKIFRKIVYIALMFGMIFFMVLPVYRELKENVPVCNKIELDSGWNLNVDGKYYNDVTLSEFSFDMCNRGDVIEMTNKIEADEEINNAILRLYSIHSVVEVYVDDELVYEYGGKRFSEGKMIGYGINFVNMPDDYLNKMIKIRLTVTEDEAFDGIQAMYIAEGSQIVRNELSQRVTTIMICMFLVLFGIIVMGLSIFMMAKDNNFINTFCIAVFSFLIGCWSTCNNDIISYFVEDNITKVYVEFLTLYALPIPFTYYFHDRVREEGNPFWLEGLFWILIAVEVAFTATAIISQALNIAHYPELLKACHLIIGGVLVLIVSINFLDIINKRQQRGGVAIGFLLALFAVVAELVKYNLSKYIWGFTDNSYNNSVGTAILVIVIGLLIDYAQSVSTTLYKDAQQNLLIKLAYADELTGLSNRRYCEDKLEEFNETKTPYAVISLDMNYLKKVNDSLGHEFGDALLKRFGDMLKEVYGEKGIVGRMGGDEFIVILPEMEERNVNNLIQNMNIVMKEKNKENPQLILSTAWGLAMSTECYDDYDSHSAYRIADARMYENKRNSKMGRKD